MRGIDSMLLTQEEDALAKDTATPVPSMSDDMHGTLKEVELAAQYAEKQYQEVCIAEFFMVGIFRRFALPHTDY